MHVCMTPSKRWFRLFPILTISCLILFLIVAQSLVTPTFLLTKVQSVLAETASQPSVRYHSETNTITIGRNSGDSPASDAIDLPTLADQLSIQGLAQLLVEQENKIWLLKANLVIERSARLDVTASTVNWLRIESPPATPLVITTRRGGHLLLEGIKLTSWESNNGVVDATPIDGRSYLLALEGGRMDILRSEISHLGWQPGEPSGLSWRKRLKNSDPTTGATGRVEESKIHNNYFGIYSYEAYGIQILHNEIYDNLYYGVDPHDDSQQFEVAYNRVYNNGTHGIIFSRLCNNNDIHHNEVFDNGQHGIMLDRGTNQNRIYNNLIYGNQDGIALFQSSDNEIYNNTIRQNRRGIRVNATFDADDVYDGISANNHIYDNQIEENSEHGIYLYARADRNRIRNNQILRSGLNGIYIKSGGNRLEGNTIRDGTVGITVVGGEYRDDPPEAAPALDPSGDHNIIISTTVAANNDVGIRILGGSHNQIGQATGQGGGQGNRIESNGKDGVAIGDATSGAFATDNAVTHNTIHNNGRHGILVTDETSVRNRISLNSITGNGQLGIKIAKAAQQGLEPPVITTVAPEYILGTTVAEATIEIYSDPGDTGQRLLQQVPATLIDPIDSEIVPAADHSWLRAYSQTDYEGQTFLGSVTAGTDGVWNFPLPTGQNPDLVSALAIDTVGNTSAFSGSRKGTNNASYEIVADEHGETTIRVSGIGSTVTLPDIANNLGASDADLLQALGDDLWLLNANLFLEIGVTLNLSPDTGVKELRLRSHASASAVEAQTIDHATFVYVRTYNGEINIDDTKIFSWDAQANDYDHDPQNGRAYLLAKYDAVMNVRNAEVGYLGSGDGESYGLTWRDVNDSSEPDVLRTRVTGEVINSLIHHNYYGIYTYQARDMLFRNNKFYENVRYGFDPHDFSHSFLVEENEAYDNGAHGFILSRGCNNIVLRNNKSYNNSDPSPSSLAHGFMLDPGSPNSKDPQSPSYSNLFENNEAYGNEGYGMRILGSYDNELRNNNFYANEMGVSIEEESIENLLIDNRLSGNRRYGVFLHETADKNTVRANEIITNSDNGIYIRSHENVIERNRVNQNGKAGIALLIKSGYPMPRDNHLISNTVRSNVTNGIDIRAVQGTEVTGNTVSENGGDGLYLKDGAIQNSIVNNCLCQNNGYGIEVHGDATVQNLWSRNSIYDNQRGGIVAISGATLLDAPTLLSLNGTTLTGESVAGATVEIFASTDVQGQYYQGRTVVGTDGTFQFTNSSGWPATNLTAIAIDPQGNLSAFSTPLVAGTTVTPTPTIPISPTPDSGTPTATPTPGAIYLPMIQSQ